MSATTSKSHKCPLSQTKEDNARASACREKEAMGAYNSLAIAKTNTKSVANLLLHVKDSTWDLGVQAYLLEVKQLITWKDDLLGISCGTKIIQTIPSQTATQLKMTTYFVTNFTIHASSGPSYLVLDSC